MKLNFVFILVIVFLTACSTTYQPLGTTGGYQDKKTSEDTYWILFEGNGHTDLKTVEAHWNTRASELCGPNGYTSEDFEVDYEMVDSVDLSGIAFGIASPSVTHYPYAVGHAQCNTTASIKPVKPTSSR